jgi:hypothetical protein
VEIGSQARTVTTDYEAVEDRIDQSIKSPFENSQTVSNNPDDDPDQQAQDTEPTEQYHQSQYFLVSHFAPLVRSLSFLAVLRCQPGLETAAPITGCQLCQRTKLPRCR